VESVARKASAIGYLAILAIVITLAGTFYAVWGAIRDAFEDLHE
jgi:hypothetical protein